MSAAVQWVTPTKVCPKCGKRFKRWNPGVGWNGVSEKRGGDPYCRPCRYAYHVKRMQGVAGKAPCAQCGRMFDLKFGTLYNARIAGRGRVYCSRACLGDHLSPYPRNPRGIGWCRAPVPGGCGKPSRGALRSGGGSFCEAHAKRRERGARIDVPVRSYQRVNVS